MTQSQIPLVALENILANAWDWEIRDYFDNDCSDDHCFNDIIAVAQWLSTVPDRQYDWGEKLEGLETDVADFRAEIERA